MNKTLSQEIMARKKLRNNLLKHRTDENRNNSTNQRKSLSPAKNMTIDFMLRFDFAKKLVILSRYSYSLEKL